jgi:hypothetical protein
MRPSSADTSDPACVKRKMLSMNTSTSVLDVAEVLGDRQAGQAHAQTRARRLVHLAVDQRHRVQDVGLLELEVQVVPLARALAHAAEHRLAAVALGDVVDQLLDDDGLADAGAAEEADLAALHERGDQVDDLDARLEDLRLGLEVDELGALAVDGPAQRIGRDVGAVVDRLAEHVEDAAQRGRADGHGDRAAGVRTGMPRTTASVDDMATARTWLRPMCCCTSAVTLMGEPSGATVSIRMAL